MNIKAIIITILLIGVTTIKAQETHEFKTIEHSYKKGVSLFDQLKFNEAQALFDRILTEIPNILVNNESIELVRINSEYYSAACALELFQKDAEERLEAFVNKFPENVKSRNANFLLGKYYYRNNQFNEALQWFERVFAYELHGKDLNEYYFKKSYCYFIQQSFEKAKAGFIKVIEKNSKYTYPAQYYLGIIEFNSFNYDEALVRFKNLESSVTYQPIIPFYIYSIYFKKNMFDSLIAFANAGKINQEIMNKNLIRELIALSFFKKGNFQMAARWFTDFNLNDSLKLLNSENIYYWAYSEFMLENSEGAKIILEKLVGYKDIFAQFGFLLLGKIFIDEDDLQAARNAFYQSLQCSGNNDNYELSILNYSKLSFELNYHTEAINTLTNFITQFPGSGKINECKSLLGEILLSTKNYQAALEVLGGIIPRNDNAQLAYQRVSFYRGVELFNNQKFEDALLLFQQAESLNMDDQITLQSTFWIGEIHYRNKNYSRAKEFFETYITSGGDSNVELFADANYSLGYIYFNDLEFMKASLYFEQAVKNLKNERKISDAYLRLGDCNFIAKNYDKAVKLYNLSISLNAQNEAYTLFQRSMIVGLQNNITSKIDGLTQLLKKHSNSPYADDALYELAYALFVKGDSKLALNYFIQLTKEYSQSTYVAKSLLNIGLIYYNNNDDDQAIETYKNIIVTYPTTAEAKEANTLLKNIYLDKGKDEEYVQFLKSQLGNAAFNSINEDSLAFESAYNQYIQGECGQATIKFEQYLKRFPQGIFTEKALNYSADCAKKNGDSVKYLSIVEQLANLDGSTYQEKAIIQLGQYYAGIKNYEKAATWFEQLNQKTQSKENHSLGISMAMKMYELALKDSMAHLFAVQVLNNPSASIVDQYRAKLINIKYELALTRDSSAIDSILRKLDEIVLGTKTESGAEAQYLKATLLFEREEFENSLNVCFELNEAIPSYDYWIGKSFILIAKNYQKLGNIFQAKSTLQSIIAEYGVSNDGIINEAKEMLIQLNSIN